MVRFPLPRLHHISRLFTVECDSCAPSRPPIVVSQKHGDIQTFTRVLSRRHPRSRCTAECDHTAQRIEPITFPRIVNLRHMQDRRFVERLYINLYACNATDSARGPIRPSVLLESMQNRLKWINESVQNTCSPVDGLRVYIRLMLNNVEDIFVVKRFRDLPYLMKPHSTVEIVVDCPSEQECHEEEFSRAKTLAVMSNKCYWRHCFDDQEIERCEALAELRSGWSTAALSPTSTEGGAIEEYHG